jgi:uncharacterized membrane-anchored protein YitT (DUF2179 family)
MTKKRPIALTILWNLLLISVGCFLCAAAIKGILIPKEFLAGGVTGLSLLLHYVLPSLPVGVIYFMLNIPLFIIGWMFVGRRFFWYSIAGVVIFSAIMFLPYPLIPIKDLILAALTAGIVTGVGSGIILRSLGSAGGLDILSVVLFKKFSIRPGTFVLGFNALLMTVAAFRIPLEMIIYTLIFMYVTSYSVNMIVTGLSQRKAIMIISPQWRQIADEIMQSMQRGVTVVRGAGGYTGKEVQILYSVVTFSELSRFKQMIRNIDPQAFVVVTETLEVMGKGIGNQPHW